MSNEDEIRKLFQTKAEAFDWLDEQKAAFEQLARLRRERLERERANPPRRTRR